jgi:hypothetical protein
MSHYIVRNIHGLEFTSDECKDGSPEQRTYVEQPQGFEVYQEETLVCKWKKVLYEFKQIGAEPPMHNKIMVKNLL